MTVATYADEACQSQFGLHSSIVEEELDEYGEYQNAPLHALRPYHQDKNVETDTDAQRGEPAHLDTKSVTTNQSMASLFGLEAVGRLVAEWQGSKVVCVIGEDVDQEALIAKVRTLKRKKGFLLNPTNAAISRTIKKKPHLLSLYTSDFKMTSALQNVIQSSRNAIVVKSDSNTIIQPKELIFWNRETQNICFEICQVASVFNRSFTAAEMRSKIPSVYMSLASSWGLFQTQKRGKRSLFKLNNAFVEELRRRKEEELMALAPKDDGHSGISSSDTFIEKQRKPYVNLLFKSGQPLKRTREKPSQGCKVDLRLKAFRQLKASISFKEQQSATPRGGIEPRLLGDPPKRTSADRRGDTTMARMKAKRHNLNTSEEG